MHISPCPASLRQLPFGLKLVANLAMLPVVAFAITMPLLLGGVGSSLNVCSFSVRHNPRSAYFARCGLCHRFSSRYGWSLIGNITESRFGYVQTWGCQKSIRIRAQMFAVSPSEGTIAAKGMVGYGPFLDMHRIQTWFGTLPRPHDLHQRLRSCCMSFNLTPLLVKRCWLCLQQWLCACGQSCGSC